MHTVVDQCNRNMLAFRIKPYQGDGKNKVVRHNMLLPLKQNPEMSSGDDITDTPSSVYAPKEQVATASDLSDNESCSDDDKWSPN